MFGEQLWLWLGLWLGLVWLWLGSGWFGCLGLVGLLGCMVVSGVVRYDIASPYCGSEHRDTHHHVFVILTHWCDKNFWHWKLVKFFMAGYGSFCFQLFR